jgi:hypothetical protein
VRIIPSLMAVLAGSIGDPMWLHSMDQFAGSWTNVDTNTGGITTLEIRVSGDSADVHAWGKCHPSDCDWGNDGSYAFAPDAFFGPS